MLCSLLLLVALLALEGAASASDTHAPRPHSKLSGSRLRRVPERRQERDPPTRRMPMAAAIQLSPIIYDSDKEDASEETTPHLLQFRGRGDDYCAMMEPLKEQLAEEYGIQIRCFEVWHDSKNLELLRIFDSGRCGGVPYFYNKRTKRWICGATTYENLRAWACDEVCEPFLPPKELIEKQQEEKSEMQNRFQQIVQKVKDTAKEKMQRRSGEDEDDE